MERWRVIDCSSMEGSLKSERGAIEVYRNDCPPVSIPVADVAVVLVGISVSFSTAVMHRLLENDIAVMFCDWKGTPFGAAHGNLAHGRVGARHQAQSRLSQPRRKNAWGRIVASKVAGQAKVLEDLGLPETLDLRSIAREVRSGDPNNFEAAAARIYWNALWGDDGFRRNPGFGKGATGWQNAPLDYGYTILRGHGIRAVMSAGLSPTIGVFHRGRSNYFSLVDDLIEPFRPAIDWSVAQLKDDADMETPQVRKYLVEAASQKFLSDGSTIPNAFSNFAQQYGRYVEGDIARLPVPFWNGS